MFSCSLALAWHITCKSLCLFFISLFFFLGLLFWRLYLILLTLDLLLLLRIIFLWSCNLIFHDFFVFHGSILNSLLVSGSYLIFSLLFFIFLYGINLYIVVLYCWWLDLWWGLVLLLLLRLFLLLGWRSFNHSLISLDLSHVFFLVLKDPYIRSCIIVYHLFFLSYVFFITYFFK